MNTQITTSLATIATIESMVVRLPFRFAFGHSTASRAYSDNVIVKVTLADGTVGFGEGIPRSYVTGETNEGAIALINSEFVPRLLGFNLSDASQTISHIWKIIDEMKIDRTRNGAAFCAVELAVLDACARANNTTVADLIGGIKQEEVQYGSVVPFGGKTATAALLVFYKLWGFKTVKIKVGGTLENDLKKLAAARQIMGPDAIIRTDANCAWTVDQTLEAASAFESFNVSSIEQPIVAEDIAGLAKITAAIKQDVVVDESLCTLADAQQLIERKACDAFNIRISKVGGLLLAGKMASMAHQAGVSVHMGAQVGESAILTAAGRAFALTQAPFENYEGSNNSWLLQDDISRENLTVSLRGMGRMQVKPGMGITVLENRLHRG